jgi:hypothetical protein
MQTLISEVVLMAILLAVVVVSARQFSAGHSDLCGWRSGAIGLKTSP